MKKKEILNELIESYYSIHSEVREQNVERMTPLMRASKREHDVVELFLYSQDEIEYRNMFGYLSESKVKYHKSKLNSLRNVIESIVESINFDCDLELELGFLSDTRNY
jgi:hypothetical protein